MVEVLEILMICKDSTESVYMQSEHYEARRGI
jgi:hypothetical protein